LAIEKLSQAAKLIKTIQANVLDMTEQLVSRDHKEDMEKLKASHEEKYAAIMKDIQDIQMLQMK
jgi:hypothetical protein